MTAPTRPLDSACWPSCDRPGRDLRANALARMSLLNARPRPQAEWRRLFAEGPEGFLAWVNLACWTFDPRRPQPRLPLVTWPVQDHAGRQIWNAIDRGRDVLIDKSRDMGATWLCLAAFAWWWLFVPDAPLLVASRKEEYVDARGNPDTLFWKLDFLIEHLPSWLRPSIARRHMHLGNLDNGSVIGGESTNADLGRGGRRKAILLDEFAAVDNGGEILSATADATPCRIFNSTPKGRANAFADVRFSGKVRVVTLHWKDHPLKGRDAQLTEIDGKRLWTSPWYRAECARRTSRKEIAQELDIDYLASGECFFDLDVCQRLRTSGQLRPPVHRGELDFQVRTRVEAASYEMGAVRWAPQAGRRRLGLWCELAPAGLAPSTGSGQGPSTGPGRAPEGLVPWTGAGQAPWARGDLRPPQDRNYVAFCDVAHGTGASNSVIKVAEADGRQEVASFVCPDIPPHELARYAVALCTWFGGRRPALLGWEANGPGGIFGLEVYRLGYRAVLGNPDPAAPWRLEDGGVGWHSTRDRKADLLGELRRALAREELLLRDAGTVTELEQYVYYPSGAIGPAALVESADGARAAHGDRVIAAAGLLLGLEHQPPAGAMRGAPPAGSFAERRAEHLRRAAGQERWET